MFIGKSAEVVSLDEALGGGVATILVTITMRRGDGDMLALSEATRRGTRK